MPTHNNTHTNARLHASTDPPHPQAGQGTCGFFQGISGGLLGVVRVTWYGSCAMQRSMHCELDLA